MIWLFCSGIFIHSCSESTTTTATEQRGAVQKDTFTYLALGDSYTIGESVDEAERWPAELARQLNDNGLKVRGPVIIAKTGWRTDDMLKAAKDQLDKEERFDIVTLLIGVNNEYQGWEPGRFKPEFEECLDYAISKCKNGHKGVFVVSIPDYGYTPYGEANQPTISSRIDVYNQICQDVSDKAGVTFFNITEISRSDKDDVSLVAGDGLHPSGKQYKLWVDSFADSLLDQIRP